MKAIEIYNNSTNPIIIHTWYEFFTYFPELENKKDLYNANFNEFEFWDPYNERNIDVELVKNNLFVLIDLKDMYNEHNEINL